MAWEDSPEYEDAVARNKARTCVRNFMTQRAIQSFMFLCETCRDPHTVKWFGALLYYCIACNSFLREYHVVAQFFYIVQRRILALQT
jgi:hypothetical protein